MAAPVWLGASPGFVGYAGAVNQFIGSHASVFGYSGSAIQASDGNGAAVYDSTDALFLAQEFTTGPSQTTIGSVQLQISTVGGSPITTTITPLTVSLYASSFGVPDGSPIATAFVPEQAVYSSPFWLSVPLGLSGVLPSTAYQLVVGAAGTATAYYVWQRSVTLFGASTAPDGSTWTTQAYGYMYRVFDNSGTTGSVQTLTDDSGARVVSFTYNANGQPATITETTQTQNGLGLTQTRTLTYSGTYVTGIS
jgi:hypothetical protein